MQSLNRPGGNATGSEIATSEMDQKRLSLLHELMPTVPLIGALLNPSSPVLRNINCQRLSRPRGPSGGAFL